MLHRHDTALVLIDIQGKLATLMHAREAFYRNLEILLRGALVLGLPVLWLEQYPKGLGPTIPQLARLLADKTPLTKTCFSAWDLPAFVRQLRETHRNQLLLAGLEAHICVYQTGRDLRIAGYQVEAVTDAISSRTSANREIGLQRLAAGGVQMTSVEMCLFELLGSAQGPAFKEIAALVK